MNGQPSNSQPQYQQQNQSNQAQYQQPQTQYRPPKKGMSTGVKVGIIAAVLVVGALLEIENVAVHDGLVVVDVGAVVGDEGAGGRAVGLGVDELVEGADTRQAGGPGLHGILAGEQRGDVGGEDLRAVGASALHGVEESEAQGSGRGSGGRVLRQRALAQGQTQPHNQRNVRHWKIPV